MYLCDYHGRDFIGRYGNNCEICNPGNYRRITKEESDRALKIAIELTKISLDNYRKSKLRLTNNEPNKNKDDSGKPAIND